MTNFESYGSVTDDEYDLVEHLTAEEEEDYWTEYRRATDLPEWY